MSQCFVSAVILGLWRQLDLGKISQTLRYIFMFKEKMIGTSMKAVYSYACVCWGVWAGYGVLLGKWI